MKLCFFLKTGIPRTYYNCYLPDGVQIDGVEDGDLMNKTMCHWEMTTGEDGTYIRTLDVEHDLHDHPEYDPDTFFTHWYYDSSSPNCTNCGDHNTPVYETPTIRDWHMCAATTSGQVIF